MEKYKSIKILEENSSLPTKAEVTFEDETTKVVENEELWTALYAFATQEGYESSYEFMQNSDKFIKKEEVVEKTKVTEKDESSKEEETEKIVTPVVVNVEKKDNKKKNKEEKTKKKRTALRIGAGAVAIMLAMGGGYVLIDYIKNQIDTHKESKRNPYIQMVDYPVNEKNGLTDRVEVMDENNGIVKNGLISVVKGNTQDRDELDEALSNQDALAWNNVTNISNFINGGTLTGDIYYTDFKSIYDINSVDYAAVQYFTELRNNIIYAAYEENSVDGTKTAVTSFNERFVSFVFGGKELKYYKINKSYKWDDLSPAAQNTILAMGMGVLTIEHDFNITIGDETYNRMITIDEVSNLREDVYEDVLMTQKFYRKNSK